MNAQEKRPKLILLIGAAGVGKTTIAQMYLDEHPLALSINGDDIIVMIGRWLEHEDEARKFVFEFTKKLARTHLEAGHDVIVPYLLTDAMHAEAFEDIASGLGVPFFEVVLSVNKQEAIHRLFDRGAWGESDAPPLTEADMPVVEALYDKMIAALSGRSSSVSIDARRGEISETYRQFLEVLS